MNVTAIGVMIVATWMGAFGAMYLKRGARQFSFAPAKLIRNYTFLAGGFIYIASIPVYLFALSLLPLSVAYPLTSMTYVWSALLAKMYLNEDISAWRWTGITLIVAGITVVSL